MPADAGDSFTIKTDLKCNYTWTVYGALCLLVARDVDGGYLETVENLAYIATDTSPVEWQSNNISKNQYGGVSASYSIDDDGYLSVTVNTNSFFTNFSMCLIPF